MTAVLVTAVATVTVVPAVSHFSVLVISSVPITTAIITTRASSTASILSSVTSTCCIRVISRTMQAVFMLCHGWLLVAFFVRQVCRQPSLIRRDIESNAETVSEASNKSPTTQHHPGSSASPPPPQPSLRRHSSHTTRALKGLHTTNTHTYAASNEPCSQYTLLHPANLVTPSTGTQCYCTVFHHST